MFTETLLQKKTDYELDTLNHGKQKDKTHLPIRAFKLMKMVKVRGQGSRSDEGYMHYDV